MAYRFGNRFSLIDPTAAYRTRIDLDQPDDIRVLSFDECGDTFEITAISQ